MFWLWFEDELDETVLLVVEKADIFLKMRLLSQKWRSQKCEKNEDSQWSWFGGCL